MKKFALGMLAAVAMTGSAVAADMAPRYAKAPPPAPVVVYNWTGCYIGGNIGGGWARTTQDRAGIVNVGPVVPATNYGSSDGSDFVGGAQIGCDYQFAGNWVLGIQGMYDYARIDQLAFPDGLPDVQVGCHHQGHLHGNGPPGLPVHAPVARLHQGWWRLDQV